MGVSNYICGILKLSVILAVIIIHSDFPLRKLAVLAELIIEPQWNLAENSSQPCMLEDRRLDERKVVLHGSERTTCSLTVDTLVEDFQNADFHYYIELQVAKHSASDSNFFLHIQRHGNLKTCPSRIVQIHSPTELCKALFLHKTLQISLLGNVSLVINEWQENQLNEKQRVTCPESGSSCNMTKFSQQILCNAHSDPSFCRLDLSANQHCNHTLSFRQITLQCQTNQMAVLVKDSFMVDFPSITVTLVLTFNNIVALRGSPFTRLQYLQALDLHGNKLEMLEDGTFSGLENLIQLFLHSNNLASLDTQVFYSLYYLRYLLLYGNKLTSLDERLFRDLHNLLRLDLDDNLLTTLPDGLFHNLGNLQELYLLDNQLVELGANVFQGTGSLLRLDLSKNQLVALPAGIFSNLKFLWQLELNLNKLVALDESLFTALENLRALYLHDNNLESIPVGVFHGLNYLIDLHLTNNQLIELDGNYFNGTMKDLEVLFLDFNNLTVLSSDIFRGMESLQFLYLHHNQLVVLDTQLHGLYNLQILQLPGNQLEILGDQLFRDLGKVAQMSLSENNLSYLPPYIFHNMRNLQILILSYNQLITLDDGQFRNLQKLIYLDFIHNNLTVLPENLFFNLTNLQELYLSYNKLTSLDSNLFEGLNQLERLYLEENMLQSLHKDLFMDLTYRIDIDLSSNLFVALPAELFRKMENLWRLDLQKNKLETLSPVTFDGLGNLELLGLTHNRLKLLPEGLFSGLTHLYSLDLYDNVLQSLPGGIFHDLNNVKNLNLEGNLLSELNGAVFLGLISLKQLSVAFNQLTTLKSDVFQGLTNLTYLILAGNKLNHISSDIFQYTKKLKYIELSQNRLNEIPSFTGLLRLKRLSLKENPLRLVRGDSFIGLNPELHLLASQHEICDCFVPEGAQRENCNAADDRSPYLTCERLLSDRVLMVMMWVIGLGAVFGNTLVLVLRQKNMVKNKVQDLLLSNLALSDLMMGVYMLIIASADLYFADNFPMESESWRSGITCRVAGSISIASSEASVFFVMLISIDRFVCIRFPYSTRKLGKYSTVVLVIITWIISLALGIAPSALSGRNFKFYDNSHVCIGLPLALTESYSVTKEFSHSYYFASDEGYFYVPVESFITNSTGLANGLFFSTATFFGLNSICYLVIVGCYIEIVRAVKVSSVQSGRTRDMKEQMTLTIKVSAIVATDFLCWCPIIVLGILVQCQVITLPPSVFAWMVTVALPINSALNPYLYTIADIIAGYRKKHAQKQIRNPASSTSKNNVSVKTVEGELSKMATSVKKDDVSKTD